MLKILVCDSGWGGELAANYLEEELGIVEVTRVIDWYHGPYTNLSRQQIEQLVDKMLQPHITKFNSIILGGYTTSLAYDYLCQKYPQQSFVRMNYDLIHLHCSKDHPQKIAIFAEQSTFSSALFQKLSSELSWAELITPNLDAWTDLIDNQSLPFSQIQAELKKFFVLSTPAIKRAEAQRRRAQRELSLAELLRQQRNLQHSHALHDTRSNPGVFSPQNLPQEIDAVILLNTHFWEIKTQLEQLLGWRVRVIDFRKKLLRDVCASLKLRGVDGNRSNR